uniref:Ubiquitin-like protease family profile domain-containing protein n=1 Tax=Ditylenchus dipsaci TaxID=166011 RepID=A0A915DGU6_9BILA
MREFSWTNSDVIEWLQGLKDKLVSLTEVMQFFKDELNVTKGKRAIYNHMPETTSEEVFIDKDEVLSLRSKYGNELKAIKEGDKFRVYTMKIRGITNALTASMSAKTNDQFLCHCYSRTVAVISLTKGSITLSVSFGQKMKEFLVLESVAKRGKAFNTMDWTFLSVKTIPTQMNGSDCGVFLCRFAECIARDADTDFKAADMNEFRKKIVQGIKSGKLI